MKGWWSVLMMVLVVNVVHGQPYPLTETGTNEESSV